MRKHDNNMPGDIADEDSENTAGGMGVDNPDLSPDATIDELVDNDVRSPLGEIFTRDNQAGGDTTGTGYAHAVNTGSTNDPGELAAGEEDTPGAGEGLLGIDMDPPERAA